MSGYLMDNFVDRERISAMAIVCRGCRPTLVLDERCARIFGFGDVDELREFLTALDDETLLASLTLVQGTTEGAGLTKAGSYVLDTKKAFDVFESRKATMSRVDIKGQI